MKKTVYKGKNIRDADLNDKPLFNHSKVGLWGVTTFGAGKSSKGNLFKVVKKEDIEIDLEFNMMSFAYEGTHTYTHNLGYIPSMVLASGRHIARDDFFSVPFSDGTTYIEITEVNKTEVKFSLKLEFANKLTIRINLINIQN